MNSLHQKFKIETKSEDGKGTFVAYGNVFNVIDDADDITMQGAFANTIANHKSNGTMPKLLLQHGHTSNPIGIITDMIEDEKGLRFEGEFNLETQAGRETYSLVKQGALDEFSIGFITLQSEKQVVNNTHVRALLELDVKEISIVTFACNPESKIESIKSALSQDDVITTRMIQGVLQESGLSKRQSEKAMNQIKTKSVDIPSEQEEKQMNDPVKDPEHKEHKETVEPKGSKNKQMEQKMGYWMEECLKTPVVSTSCVQEILWYLPPSALEIIITAAEAGRVLQANALGLCEEKSSVVGDTNEDEEKSDDEVVEDEDDEKAEESETTDSEDESDVDEEKSISFTTEQLEQISKMSE